MTKLHDQIEDMQHRLGQNAQTEQTFVKALSEALSLVDNHLLNEVRRVTAEHEARRGAIYDALQDLAGRLCSFPAEPPPAMTEIAASAAEPSPVATLQRVNGHLHAPGDWRKATSNIEDDADYHWKADGPSH
ncbi:MAG: hypothetical protein ACT4N2_15615 [Hyphomicrobium sp.]